MVTKSLADSAKAGIDWDKPLDATRKELNEDDRMSDVLRREMNVWYSLLQSVVNCICVITGTSGVNVAASIYRMLLRSAMEHPGLYHYCQ